MLRPRWRDSVRSRKQFLIEARALARVKHPNVLTIHSVIESDERIALSTEFVEGASWEEILRERGPLGPDEAVAVGRDICRALCAVHAGGLVHRDVKLSNLLREEGGRTVLTDFGLGAFVDDTCESEGVVRGSPLYMAPEQVRGETVDARTDVYATGVAIFALLTGKFPVTGDGIDDLLDNISAGNTRSLIDVRPGLPSALADIVSRALATRPVDRFQTAGELDAALAEVTERTPVVDGTSRPTRWLMLAAFAAAALVVLSLALWPPSSSPAFEADARFSMIGGSDSTVELEDGDRLEAGDKIVLRYQANQTRYVYVLNQDGFGEISLLFPRHRSVSENPLAADVRHELPGRIEFELPSGDRRVLGGAWEVTPSGGDEWLFVIATTVPIEALEDVPASAERVAMAYPMTVENTTDLLRGFRVAPKDIEELERGDRRLSSIVEQLIPAEEGLDEERGWWIGRWRLEGAR